MPIYVRIVGGQKVMDAIDLLGSSLMDFAEVLSVAGEELINFYSGPVFASQGGAIGEKWTPLKDATAIYKARNWPGRTILIESGKMKNSFTFTSSSTFLIISNPNHLFKYHQLGTRNMPARVMLKLDEQRKMIVERLIAADIRDKIDQVMES